MHPWGRDSIGDTSVFRNSLHDLGVLILQGTQPGGPDSMSTEIQRMSNGVVS